MSADDASRFWAKVDKLPSGCWVWTACRNWAGYGLIGNFRGKTRVAHRVAWWLHHGAEPRGMVLHRCDNRACCNPAHLFLGDAKSNYADARQKDRHCARERHGNARLTEIAVADIRRRVAAGETQTAVAREYGVAQQCVSGIVHRKAWV